MQKGLEAVKEYEYQADSERLTREQRLDDHYAAAFAHFAMMLPSLLSVFVACFVVGFGACIMFTTSIPALFAFLHITIIQVVLVTPLLLGFRWHLGKATSRVSWTMDEYFFVCQSVIGVSQAVSGLGIIAWAWYLPDGPTYTAIHDAYFAAFGLPTITWEFEFFSFSRLLSFSLGNFEMFGTSIVLQLITMCFSLFRRATGALCLFWW